MRIIPMVYYAYPYHYSLLTYFPPPFNEHWSRPQSMYPPVDIKKLQESAHKYKTLMNQALLLVNKIASSPSFSHNLMDAAQKSNQKKVNELILSTGITVKVKSSYTPDGIKFDFSNIENQVLSIVLRW